MVSVKTNLDEEQIQAYCEAADGTNGILFYIKVQLLKTTIRDKDLVVLSALSRALDEDYEQQLFEKVLDYYWERKDVWGIETCTFLCGMEELKRRKQNSYDPLFHSRG